LPRIEFSLHVGDQIEYRSALDQVVTRATVREIGPNFDRTESIDRVATTAVLTNFSSYNPDFRIIRSEHDDAPPVGVSTSLLKVNLVRGSMPKAEIKRVREREREER